MQGYWKHHNWHITQLALAHRLLPAQAQSPTLCFSAWVTSSRHRLTQAMLLLLLNPYWNSAICSSRGRWVGGRELLTPGQRCGSSSHSDAEGMAVAARGGAHTVAQRVLAVVASCRSPTHLQPLHQVVDAQGGGEVARDVVGALVQVARLNIVLHWGGAAVPEVMGQSGVNAKGPFIIW